MGVVRRYIDILIIIITFPYSTCISSFLAVSSLFLCSFKKCFFILVIITFPYSTCISSFFGSNITITPISLFILKMFFRPCLSYFCAML